MPDTLIDKPEPRRVIPLAVQELQKKKPETLVNLLNKELAGADDLAKRSILKYVRAGELLLAIREKARGYGEWGITLDALRLSKSRANTLLNLGYHGERVRTVFVERPDLTLEAAENLVRGLNDIPLADQPNDVDALVKMADEGTKRAKTRKASGASVERLMQRALDALESHAHDDPMSPEVAKTMSIARSRLEAIWTHLNEHSPAPPGALLQ